MKMLRNRKTGVLFPYHPILEKYHRDMVPVDEGGRSAFEEVNIDTSAQQPAPSDEPGSGEDEAQDPDGEDPAESYGKSGDGIIISRARKDELLAFAKEHYGVDLEDSLDVKTLRQEVSRLVDGE